MDVQYLTKVYLEWEGQENGQRRPIISFENVVYSPDKEEQSAEEWRNVEEELALFLEPLVVKEGTPMEPIVDLPMEEPAGTHGAEAEAEAPVPEDVAVVEGDDLENLEEEAMILELNPVDEKIWPDGYADEDMG